MTIKEIKVLRIIVEHDANMEQERNRYKEVGGFKGYINKSLEIKEATARKIVNVLEGLNGIGC